MLKNLLAIAIFTLSAFAQNHPARTSAGCGPSGAQYNVKSDKTPQPIASPESGKAALYVIQYERRDVEAFHIGAVTTRVGLDGTWQGANHGQSYLLVPVDPGGASPLRRLAVQCGGASETGVRRHPHGRSGQGLLLSRHR